MIWLPRKALLGSAILCSYLCSFLDTVGKEFACNAGDPGLIPGSGRSPAEGLGYPLQYSCVSLVAQLVKNPPAMWETWVWSLGWEDTLEKGKATHSSILAWRIPGTKSQTWLSVFHFHFHAGFWEKQRSRGRNVTPGPPPMLDHRDVFLTMPPDRDRVKGRCR